MTQTHSQTTRHILRQRAQIIVDALKAAATPTTYADIIRAARAIMTVDKMLKQLWPEDKKAKGDAAAPCEDEALPAPSQPLNRQQRRAEAARQRSGSLKTSRESEPNRQIPLPA